MKKMCNRLIKKWVETQCQVVVNECWCSWFGSLWMGLLTHLGWQSVCLTHLFCDWWIFYYSAKIQQVSDFTNIPTCCCFRWNHLIRFTVQLVIHHNSDSLQNHICALFNCSWSLVTGRFPDSYLHIMQINNKPTYQATHMKCIQYIYYFYL